MPRFPLCKQVCSRDLNDSHYLSFYNVSIFVRWFHIKPVYTYLLIVDNETSEKKLSVDPATGVNFFRTKGKLQTLFVCKRGSGCDFTCILVY